MKIKASSKYRALVDCEDIEAGDEVTVTEVSEGYYVSDGLHYGEGYVDDGVNYVWTTRPRKTEGDTPLITAIPVHVFIHCFEEV